MKIVWGHQVYLSWTYWPVKRGVNVSNCKKSEKKYLDRMEGGTGQIFFIGFSANHWFITFQSFIEKTFESSQDFFSCPNQSNVRVVLIFMIIAVIAIIAIKPEVEKLLLIIRHLQLYHLHIISNVFVHILIIFKIVMILVAMITMIFMTKHSFLHYLRSLRFPQLSSQLFPTWNCRRCWSWWRSWW